MQHKAAVIVEDDCEAAFAKLRCVGTIAEDSFSESAAIALVTLKKQSNDVLAFGKHFIESDQRTPIPPNTPCVDLPETSSKLLTPSVQDSTYENTVSSKRRRNVEQSDYDGLTKRALIQPRLLHATPLRVLPSVRVKNVSGLPQGRPMPPAPRLPNRILSAPVGRKVAAKTATKSK